MAWIESHQELRDHPKTKRAARMLGIGIPQMVGHLQFLWWWSVDYAEDGDLSRFDEYDVADAAGWEGDADAFVRALIECGPSDSHGFLNDDWTLHDWGDYAGKLVAQREANRKRQRRFRDKHATNKEETRTTAARNAHVTRDKRVSHRATLQNPTEQDRTEEGECEGEACTAPNGTESAASQPEIPEITDISPVERFVVDCVQAVRGAATIPDHEIVEHFRHNLTIRGSPVSEMTIRREFTKFRDFHQPKRANQPKNGRWRGWKNAMTNWVGRIPDEPEPEIDRLTALYGPEYGVDE